MPTTYIGKLAKKHGFPIEDATRPCSIVVTQHDVIYSRKGDSGDCAMSCAARRIKGVRNAFFFRTTAYLEINGTYVRYLLPTSIRRQIAIFDYTKQFAPGLYNLLAPSAKQTLRAKIVKNNQEQKRRRKPRFRNRHPANQKQIELLVKIRKLSESERRPEMGDYQKLQKVVDDLNKSYQTGQPGLADDQTSSLFRGVKLPKSLVQAERYHKLRETRAFRGAKRHQTKNQKG